MLQFPQFGVSLILNKVLTVVIVPCTLILLVLVYIFPSHFREPSTGIGLSISPFLETIDGQGIEIYSLSADKVQLLSRVLTANSRNFPKNRIIPPLSAFPIEDKKRAAEELLDPKRLIVNREDGGITLLPTMRPQIYYRQFVGLKNLPLIKLEQANILNLDITYVIQRTIENESLALQSSVNNNRIQLIWCDDKGVRLKTMKPETIVLFADTSNQQLTDRAKSITIPKGAVTMRLDLQLPTVDSLHIIDLKIVAEKVNRILNPHHATLDKVTKGKSVRVSSHFSQITQNSKDSKIVSQGVSGFIGATKVYIAKGNHQWIELNETDSYYLNSFSPQVIRIFDQAGKEFILSFGLSDGVELNYKNKRLSFNNFIYFSEERAFHQIGQFNHKGIRLHQNLGVSDHLPEMETEIILTPALAANIVAFPAWQPQNRLATFIFTEHADRQQLATDKMVTYGNLDGVIVPGLGLAGNHIAVTKSVFYKKPETWVNNKDRSKPWADTLSDAPFEALIQSYLEDGLPFEIALHTPTESDDDLALVEEALKKLNSYSGRVWIDHGNQNNLEDLNRLGAINDKQGRYIISLLNQYGIDYAWNYNDIQFKGLGILRDGRTANLLYDLPMVVDQAFENKKIHFFSTKRVVFKELGIKEADIQSLIKDRNISIIHSYFSLNRGGQIEYDGSKPVALAPWFNNLLQWLADARDKGDLYLTTLSEWGDYVRQIRDIKIRHGEQGIQLENTNQSMINKMTLVVTALKEKIQQCNLDGIAIEEKRIENGVYYFSFDLPVGNHMFECH